MDNRSSISDNTHTGSTDDTRSSGMRMLANFMFRAWRARQAEYKNLLKVNMHFKDDLLNAKTKLKSITEDIVAEKESNVKKALEIKKINEEIEFIKIQAKKLEESADKKKIRKLMLLQDYEVKCRECENGFVQLAQIKSEIRNVLVRQLQLQKAFAFEKQKADGLKQQNATIKKEVAKVHQSNIERRSSMDKKKEAVQQVEHLKAVVAQAKSNVGRLRKELNLDSVMDRELRKLNLEIAEIYVKDGKLNVFFEYCCRFFTINAVYLLMTFFVTQQFRTKPF